MTEPTIQKDKTLLYVAIYLAIIAVFFIVPPIEPITAAGMKLLGVFFAAIFGWSVTSDVWPSFLTFVFLTLTGLLNLQGVVTAGWGSDTFIFMLMGFILIAYMEDSGASSFIAAWLMTRKALVGHPWRLLFMIFLIAWVISAFVNIFAGMLLTWGFIYQICGILDYKPFDKFSNLLVFGVGVMGALSLSGLPWAGNALVILAAFMQNTGLTVNYAHYLCYSLPVVLFSILGYLALCKFAFRLDVSKLKNLTIDFINPNDLLMTKSRKIALIGIAILIAFILLPSFISPESAVGSFCAQIGLTGKAFIVFTILALIKVDGKPAFDFPKLARKGVNWNMVIMTMGILAFVGMLGNPETGISAFLSGVLAPVFAGKPVFLFFLIAMAVLIVLTNFMINMVVAVIMMTATFPVAVTLGIDLTQLAYLYTIGATIAFFLPAASAASCVLFSNSAWVRAKDVYKYALPTILMISAIAMIWNFIVFLF